MPFSFNPITGKLDLVNSGNVTNITASSPLSSSGGTTPNITIQNADSTHTGALTSTDWNTFNSKQSSLTFGSISTSTTGVTIGSGSNSTVGPNVTVNIQTASGSQTGLLLSTDWNTFNNKGNGSVTSVAMTVPSFLSVSGSPITTSGTLAVTLATELANTVFAGPTSGGAATPTFRSLVAGDLPAGTGTVTSVALADSTGLFNITGSPITGAGTLTLSSFQSQAQKTFFAAPNGSAGSPTFRLILASDVPTLNQNTTGSSSSFTGSLLGDVTGTQGATVVSKIQGITVSGTTGTGNVVFSASPTFTGTITAAAANFSGAISASNFSGSSSGSNTGDVTLAAFGSTPNANGASLAGQVLTLQPADNTHPGGISITTQTIAGNKTFTGNTTNANITINGTGGNGFINYTAQSSTPATPSSGFTVYADSTNRFSQVNTAGFTTTFDSSGITGNRVYTLRDVSGKFLLDTRLSMAGTSVSGTLTILNTDAFAVYFVDTTAARTINLPTSSSVADRAYIFKDISGQANTNNISIVPNGTDKIEGLNVTKLLETNYGSWTLLSDGAGNWWMV